MIPCSYSSRPRARSAGGLLALSAVLLVAGCEGKSHQKKNMPAATDWQAPSVGSPGPGPARRGPIDPHAGVPGAPPIGGQGGNPHAGIPGAPPLGDDQLATDEPGDQGGALSLPPPDPSRPIDESKFLAGTVTVPAALASKIPVGAAIFLSVRPEGGGGMPMAVDKLTATGTWPLSFRITAAKAMVDGTAFTGPVVISARYDQDGEAMKAQPGDIAGTVNASIPADGLVIDLANVVP